MPEQLPFDLPQPDETEVQRFVRMLRRNGGWLTASAVLEKMHMPVSESNRRKVRSWAEDAGGAVISGQNGYRHVKSASNEEIGHFLAWMESQVSKMRLRVMRTRLQAPHVVDQETRNRQIHAWFSQPTESA